MLGKNRTLLLISILVIVLALYFVLEQLGDQESNFRTRLPEFDTALVNRVEVMAAATGETFSLARDGDSWVVLQDGKSHAADPFAARSLLAGLNGTEIRNVVATVSDGWETYKVSDKSATRIRYLEDDDMLADVLLGRFEYIQPESQVPDQYGRRPQGEMISYVRLYDEQPVYSIDGMIALGLGKQAADYRDKRLVSLKKEAFTRFEFDYGNEGSFILVKAGGSWLVNDQPADSASVAAYLNGIAGLRGTSFSDLDTEGKTSHREVKVFAGPGEPVVLKAYVHDSSTYLISSSRNPTNLFLEDSVLTEKAFVPRNTLLKGASR